jgi:hypothetical protein
MKNIATKLPRMDEETEPIWKELRRERARRIRDLLRQAQLLIPQPHLVPAPSDPPPHICYSELKGTLEEFELFFYHGEYESAWGILTSVASREKPTKECWDLLAEAAMVLRKFERHDSFFMGELVRHRVDRSRELDEAIQSLPLRFEDPPDSVAANEIVARLSGGRRHNEDA